MNKHISYSQYSIWCGCPFRWKLKYVDSIQLTKSNIYLVFGKAMHSVFQKYLTIMYESTIKKADELDLPQFLQEELFAEVKKIKEEEKELPCTKTDLYEFFEQGVIMLEWFKKNRAKYFSRKDWTLLGCEVPLNIKLENNINFIGFLDIVLQHKPTKQIKIIDIKTSTMGWNKYQKQDKIKTSQLLLYKKFYSHQFNCPIEKISVEYLILKRKLYENFQYPQRRIQTFTPAHGKISINNVGKSLTTFINQSFDETGNYKMGAVKTPSKKSCKYCEFRDTKYCDGENK